VEARLPHRLRDLRVGVQSAQRVAALAHRRQHRVVGEAPREGEVARVLRVGVEVGEHLGKPAVLARHHATELRVVERHEDAVQPVGEAARDGERLGVAGEAVGVAQPGEHLVVGVERDPEPVEVEALRADVPLRDLLLEDTLAVGEGAEVAVAVRGLHEGELPDDVARGVAEARVARDLPRERHGAEVVPERVPRDAARLPPAVGLGPHREPRLAAEAGEQAVGLVVAQQVRDGAVLRLAEGAVEQGDLLERERSRGGGGGMRGARDPRDGVAEEEGPTRDADGTDGEGERDDGRTAGRGHGRGSWRGLVDGAGA
jgi:hypothetical protein